MSTRGPVPQFLDAMHAAGLRPPANLTADGKLHRFHVEGDQRGTRNGWYVLYPDAPPAGAFGCWKRGVDVKWSAKPDVDFTPQERQAWLRRMDEAKRAREEAEKGERERTATRAGKRWGDAGPADPGHPYLQAKGIQPHGIRQSGDKLLVPVTSGGERRGIQFIGPDGSKRFLKGTPKRGSYHPIGRPNGTIAICEGYATAASVHEATGHAAVVAFDAGNLPHVARAMRERFPDARIIIAGDNDHRTNGNPGRKAASEAAKAVDGIVAVPDYAPGEDGTDWNDYATAFGLPAVASAIARAADPAGPRKLADLLADPNAFKLPKAIAPRFGWESRVTLFVAREKAGKSTTARIVASKVSAGAFLLGERCERRPVLLFVLEEFIGDAVRQLVEFGADPENVYIVDRLASPLADYAAMIADLRPGLVVVDTLAAFAALLPDPPQAGDSAAWTPVMSGLTRPCRDHGAALLLLAHARKSDGEYRDSTAIGAGVDMILTMGDGQDDSSRKVKAKGRFHVEDFSFVLVGNDLRFADGTLPVEARVLGHIMAHPAATTRDVRDGVGARAADVDDAIRGLERAGSIHDHGSGNRRAWYAPPMCPGTCPASSAFQPEIDPMCPEKNGGDTRRTRPGHVTGHASPNNVSQRETYRVPHGTHGPDEERQPHPLDDLLEVGEDAA
jgi:phage/plasmid primase-like uncharacterized protein